MSPPDKLRSSYDQVEDDVARLVKDVASLQRQIDQALADTASNAAAQAEKFRTLRAEIDRCTHQLASVRTVLGANLDELDRLFPVVAKAAEKK